MQIGVLAKRTGLTASRIRFYEAQGLISVGRRANGYRIYSPPALQKLHIIPSAQDAAFTHEAIRRLMPGGLSGGYVGSMVRSVVENRYLLSVMEKRLARTRLQIE